MFVKWVASAGALVCGELCHCFTLYTWDVLTGGGCWWWVLYLLVLRC